MWKSISPIDYSELGNVDNGKSDNLKLGLVENFAIRITFYRYSAIFLIISLNIT
jgi:hypothetical protein